jgi:Cd2+/Zn2+-exporting ATPase
MEKKESFQSPFLNSKSDNLGESKETVAACNSFEATSSCSCCGSQIKADSESLSSSKNLQRYFLFGGIILFALGFCVPSIASNAFYYAATSLAGFSIFKSTILLARKGVFFTMEMLMTLATVGAIVINQVEEAAAVVVLFGVGQILEEFAASRARKSIASLLKRAPRVATLREGNQTREIPATQIVRGQILDVLPGGMVPTDGVVVEGAASFDESVLTGESRPVLHGKGDRVIAGAISLDGRVQIEATAAYIENTYSRIIRLVEESAGSQGRTQRFVESFAARYTPAVMLFALVVMLAPLLGFSGGFQAWFYKGLAVLLIGCPCALVISIPAAVTSAISRASRMGILVKGGETLEALGQVTTAFVDKTGTVTHGRIQVVQVRSFLDSVTQEDLLALAGSVEQASSHPIAVAVVAEAKQRGVLLAPVANGTTHPGRGVAGYVGADFVEVLSPTEAERRGNLGSLGTEFVLSAEKNGFTGVLVHKNEKLLGCLVLSDTVRPDSFGALKTLSGSLGVNVTMLTGDNELAANRIAKELEIDVRARCLPEDKASIVQSKAKNSVVAMVGDGINDAPALAAAHVSVAMGTGTDVAMETANVVLASGSLTGLVNGIRISRAARGIIVQNVVFALGLKVSFLAMAFAGMATLWMAIVADTGATLLVTMNSLRLLRYGK